MEPETWVAKHGVHALCGLQPAHANRAVTKSCQTLKNAHGAATRRRSEACGYTRLHLTEASGGRPFWLNPRRSALGVSLPHPPPFLPTLRRLLPATTRQFAEFEHRFACACCSTAAPVEGTV